MSRILAELKNLADLGRYYLLTRKPHIELELPSDLPHASWVVIATTELLEGGRPVYGTPSHRAARPGERVFVFVPEGQYHLYVVQSSSVDDALRAFYADPGAARLVATDMESSRGA